MAMKRKSAITIALVLSIMAALVPNTVQAKKISRMPEQKFC